MPAEFFKPVPGFLENVIRVGDHGTILHYSRYHRKWQPIKSSPKSGTNMGWRVTFKEDGKRYHPGVAALVCRAFHGPRPLGNVPLHYPDPNPANCCADNVRWAPIGSHKLASKCDRYFGPPPILTAKIVHNMRWLRRRGYAIKDIALRYGVAYTTAQHAIHGRTWKHLSGAVPPTRGPRHARRLSEFSESVVPSA